MIGTIGVRPDGGDGGDGGGKIICTAMNQTYGFGGFRNALWMKYQFKINFCLLYRYV